MDLYFAGASHNLASKMIIDLGCNRLFSQEINRNEITRMVELRRSKGYSGKILIDSGAFTAHTKGIEIDVDEYISYLNDISDAVDVYAQVDKIPGQFGKPKTQEQLMQAPIQSWENYLYMRERLKEPDKLMPIYHQGEELKWLHNMLETTFNGKHIPYIGISPANDKSQPEKNKFIRMCFDTIAKSSNPNVKTHAYGMTNLGILSQFPFTSADSTSWALTAVNGAIMTPWGVIALSDQNKTSSSYRGMSKLQQDKINKLISDNGFNILDMVEAPEEVVIERIMKKIDLKWLEVYDVLHCRDTKRTKPKQGTRIRGPKLSIFQKPEIGTTGRNFDNITREQADVIKFEKGRSIAANNDYKAYLERIRWNIAYLKRWSDKYEYRPTTSTKRSLLH